MTSRSNLGLLRVLAIAIGLLAVAAVADAQVAVSVPFKFEAGGKAFPPGDYVIELKKEGAIGVRSTLNGAELVIAAKERQKPTRSIQQPELVFDMVGNFEPSFSEYVTDYLLSEVWLPGVDGVIVLTTISKHDHRTVQGKLAPSRR